MSPFRDAHKPPYMTLAFIRTTPPCSLLHLLFSNNRLFFSISIRRSSHLPAVFISLRTKPRFHMAISSGYISLLSTIHFQNTVSHTTSATLRLRLLLQYFLPFHIPRLLAFLSLTHKSHDWSSVSQAANQGIPLRLSRPSGLLHVGPFFLLLHILLGR